jgi:hypothetical protein
VGERLKPAVLKTVRLERASGVRIPPPPPRLRTTLNMRLFTFASNLLPQSSDWKLDAAAIPSSNFYKCVNLAIDGIMGELPKDVAIAPAT